MELHEVKCEDCELKSWQKDDIPCSVCTINYIHRNHFIRDESRRI